jgi:LPXTG-motif cell wall-anchored protein
MALRTVDQEAASLRSRSRAIRTGSAVAAAVAAVAAVLLWGATAQATAAGAVAVPTVTPTATEKPGNATVCTGDKDAANLSGTVILSSADDPDGLNGSKTGVGEGTVDADQKVLTVHLDAGVTASGVVVKGGDNFNVYVGPFVGEITIAGMTAPLVGQDKNVPVISHWFVCGGPSESESPSPSSSPSASSSPTAEPSSPGTSTSTSGGSLPVTGTAITGIVIAGVALIGGGAALLFLRRRRDVTDATS